MEMKRWY